MARRMTMAACLLALLLAGCQKLNYEQKVELTPMQVKEFLIDAPSGDQKIKVQVDATGSPVDVWVALGSNQDAVKQKLMAGKQPDNTLLLASAARQESATVEATVPAGKEFAVFVSGATKKTEVKVKITGG